MKKTFLKHQEKSKYLFFITYSLKLKGNISVCSFLRNYFLQICLNIHSFCFIFEA